MRCLAARKSGVAAEIICCHDGLPDEFGIMRMAISSFLTLCAPKEDATAGRCHQRQGCIIRDNRIKVDPDRREAADKGQDRGFGPEHRNICARAFGGNMDSKELRAKTAGRPQIHALSFVRYAPKLTDKSASDLIGACRKNARGASLMHRNNDKATSKEPR